MHLFLILGVLQLDAVALDLVIVFDIFAKFFHSVKVLLLDARLFGQGILLTSVYFKLRIAVLALAYRFVVIVLSRHLYIILRTSIPFYG